jgi:hypothetical protein
MAHNVPKTKGGAQENKIAIVAAKFITIGVSYEKSI